MNYTTAIKQIINQRRAQLTNYEQAIFFAIDNDPFLKKIDDEIKDLVLLSAKGKTIDSNKLESLQRQKAIALNAKNITMPPYSCKICNDTGVKNGKPCACAIKLVISGNNTITLPLHDLADCNFLIFDNNDAPRIKKIYADIKKIIETYPDCKKRNIIIMGGTGTGKTFLAGVATKLMLDNSMSVMALTAFSLNNHFLKYHTTFDETKASYLEPLIDCEALIIDDLGTESILKNVTLEYLYQIANERALTNKLTLITTNLSPDDILNRYGARIYSRLFDKQLLYAKILTGKDLRNFK